MSINIYKDKLKEAYLFGSAVLYSPEPIPREDVPEKWFCYDLRGTDQAPRKPYSLVDRTENKHAGSILSPCPLKHFDAQSRIVRDKFCLMPNQIGLDEFCQKENLPCPQLPIRHMLRPASPEEAGYFYALTPEEDDEQGTIGHIRIDFGRSGKEFWHTWWPRGPEERNTQEFRDELNQVVNDLRKGVLKDLSSMRRECHGSEGAIEGGACCQNYGFVLETERYLYRLRCNPVNGDYQAYLHCFDKQAQKLELCEEPSNGRTFASGEQEKFNDPPVSTEELEEEAEAGIMFGGM